MPNFITKLFAHKDYYERGKKIILIHKGKYTTYQKYRETSQELADKYLDFVGKNPDAIYIRWDKEKKRFTA